MSWSFSPPSSLSFASIFSQQKFPQSKCKTKLFFSQSWGKRLFIHGDSVSPVPIEPASTGQLLNKGNRPSTWDFPQVTIFRIQLHPQNETTKQEGGGKMAQPTCLPVVSGLCVLCSQPRFKYFTFFFLMCESSNSEKQTVQHLTKIAAGHYPAACESQMQAHLCH